MVVVVIVVVVGGAAAAVVVAAAVTLASAKAACSTITSHTKPRVGCRKSHNPLAEIEFWEDLASIVLPTQPSICASPGASVRVSV